MTRKLFAPLLVLILAVVACNLPSSTPTAAPLTVTDTPMPPAITDTPTVTASPEPPVMTPVPGGLTFEMLRNATYYAPVYGRTVTLTNGTYSEGTGASVYTVTLLNVYAFGDLNGDGNFDAAALLVENGGGTGQFVSVIAVLNQGGAPHQVSEIPLGDRVLVNSADISSGVIHLNMAVHGPDDPLCCPSQPQIQSFWLLGNNLWLMRITSGASGTERAINITSPAQWGSVTNPFTVNGNVLISPFENTLKYTIYLLDGTVVNTSSLTVTSAGAGTPGTFSREFNLSAAGISGLIVIQFDELSPADGSLLTRGSVVLNLH